MCVLVCSQGRPLGLFEVLTRNRQSALGRLRRTSSAQEKTPQMFTIPPRQRLPITRRLAIRGWRVARARIRIRIRIRIGIIARVLKLPRPCTILKRERETHKHRHFSLHYISFFCPRISYIYIRNNARGKLSLRLRTNTPPLSLSAQKKNTTTFCVLCVRAQKTFFRTQWGKEKHHHPMM